MNWRREFARVDDADLRHIERTGNAGHAGRQGEDKSFRPRPDSRGKRVRASASRIATSTLPNFELTITRQITKPIISAAPRS